MTSEPVKTPDAPPAWLNLHAVVDEETVDALRQLAERIEETIESLVPLLDRCYRTLRKVSEAVSEADLGEIARSYRGEGVWDAIHIYSGAGRLSDLLYLLAAHVDAACGEKVDEDIAWLRTAPAEFGLDAWDSPKAYAEGRAAREAASAPRAQE